MNTIEKFDSHVMQTYGRYPLVMESGNGSTAKDENGKEYIDLGSGIGTNSLGYCDPDWVEAVTNQVKTLQHTSNYYYTKVQADFAEKLCDVTGYKNLFFGNSGAEANECAIKLARKYSFDKYGKGRSKVITLLNSFHGRTLTTLSATGQPVFHNYFFPFTEGFDYVMASDLESLKEKLDGTVCAVIVEFIQGEGGVVPLDKEYAKQLYDICQANDILFVADEVQTGVGRTGTFLASEQYDIKPDITTLAKGIASGIPIGACLANEKCADVLVKSTHGSTFGGNPLACAGGLVVVNKVSKKEFLDDVNKKGQLIRATLSKCNDVKEITGLGMMIGISLKEKNSAEVAKKAFENGLLVLTAKEKVRLLPPLNISTSNLLKGLEILSDLL